MRLGILALVLVFLASGASSLKDSGIVIGRKNRAVKENKTQGPNVSQTDKDKEQEVFSRRKMFFGMLLMLVGTLILIYYIVTI